MIIAEQRGHRTRPGSQTESLVRVSRFGVFLAKTGPMSFSRLITVRLHAQPTSLHDLKSK